MRAVAASAAVKVMKDDHRRDGHDPAEPRRSWLRIILSPLLALAHRVVGRHHDHPETEH